MMCKTMLDRTLLVAACVVVVSGCINHAYSPPARLAMTESPATVAPEHWTIAASGGGGGDVFGPTIVGGTVAARTGINDSLDVAFEGTLAYAYDKETEVVNATTDETKEVLRHSFGVAAATRLKYQFCPFASLAGGVGIGGTDMGGFLAPDLALIVGWENPYFVPFVTEDITLSLPFAPQPIDVGEDDDGTDLLDSPNMTLHVSTTGGFKVPLGGWETGHAPVSLIGTLTYDWAVDKDENDTFFAIGGGVEVAL